MPAGTPLHLFICPQHTPILSHPISSSLPYLFFISRLSSFKNLCSFNLVMAMSARSISTFSVSNKQGGDGVANISSSSSLLFNSSKLGSSSTLSFNQQQGKRRNLAVSISASSEPLLTGVVFHPFEEVKKEALALPVSPQLSLARQGFADHCESAINEQINVEYNVSYVYHAMFAYFDRDNVALKGLAKFYEESSEEERDHAEKLMKYQNIRGGKVKLHSIINPPSEFEHAEKGDALYAMELALSLEKLTNEKLLSLHRVAQDSNDAQLTDFIESEFLTEQVEAIKKIAEYVTQLRLVGKGHGVWHFDQQLLHEG